MESLGTWRVGGLSMWEISRHISTLKGKGVLTGVMRLISLLNKYLLSPRPSK